MLLGWKWDHVGLLSFLLLKDNHADLAMVEQFGRLISLNFMIKRCFEAFMVDKAGFD